jgi:hypothetical protein
MRPDLILNLIFTVALPVLMLQHNLFGLGWGVYLWVGNIGAFMLAALIPFGYLLFSQTKHKTVSPLWLMVTTSALLGALAAFWWVGGIWFAIKDSLGSIFLALSALISMLFRKPLFYWVLLEFLGPKTPQERELLEWANKQKPVVFLTYSSTLLLMIKGSSVALLNIWVKYHTVTAAFGTPEFNGQLSRAITIMIPSAYLATTFTYSLITFFWWRAFKMPLKTILKRSSWWDSLERYSRG